MLGSDLISCDSSLLWRRGVAPSLQSIEGITTVEFPKALHFIFVKNKKFFDKVKALPEDSLSSLGIVISQEFYEKEREEIEKRPFAWLATSSDIASSMVTLSEFFYKEKFKNIDLIKDGRESGRVEIHPSCRIAPGVFIGEGVVLSEGVVLHHGVSVMAHCEIGKDTELFPKVTLYPFTKIGYGCRIHAGTSLGSDGFGYIFHQGVHRKIWHLGGVIVGNHVEIGSNTSVDSGTFAPTVIGSGSKIDNLVQVAHNCQLGQGVIICGQAGLAGSCKLGDFCVLAGHSGLAPDITLGKGCQLAGGCLVGCDWPDHSMLAGHPGRPLNEWLRGVAFVRKESLKGKSKSENLKS